MSYNLFLDDYRQPKDVYNYTHNQLYLLDWHIVKDYNEFIKTIENQGIPEIISFDHDLADEHYGMQDQITQDDYDLYKEKTGYQCAKWLINYCIDNKKELPQTILIHSMNVCGSQNIKSLFRSYNKTLNLSSS